MLILTCIVILHIEGLQWNSEYSASLRRANKCASKVAAAAPAVFIVILETERKQCDVSVSEHGTAYCSKLRALSPSTGTRDWYYIYLIHYYY
jgi:hypothetical protein